MVPAKWTIGAACVGWLFAATAPAQQLDARDELIRSGGVVNAAYTPQESPPSQLESPVYPRDAFVQPAAYQAETPQADDAGPALLHPSTAAATDSSASSAAAKGIPLTRRQSPKRGEGERPKLTTPLESLTTVGGSLAVVLGLFFALALVTRRGLPARVGKLPGEVIEVLGKTSISKGQELQMVRVGGKLLLICLTPHGAETLTEIDDPDEVDRLSAVCRRNSPQGVSATFDHMLTHIGREPARGFSEDPRTSAARGGRRHG